MYVKHYINVCFSNGAQVFGTRFLLGFNSKVLQEFELNGKNKEQQR